MTTDFLVGILLTAIALGGMVAWAYHEIRRVDEVIEEVDERLHGDTHRDEVMERVDGRVREDVDQKERELA